jgi:hypothetical protein
LEKLKKQNFFVTSNVQGLVKENYCKNVPLMTFLIVFWSGNANMMEVLEARNSSEGVKQTSVFQASKQLKKLIVMRVKILIFKVLATLP